MSSHATGPRSDAGKERSSLNAVQHGLRSERPVIPGEDAAEWDAFRADVVADLDPATTLERELADRAALQLWRLRRAARYEAEAAVDAAEAVRRDQSLGVGYLGPADPPSQALLLVLGRLEDALKGLARIEAARDLARRLPDLPGGAAVDAVTLAALLAVLGLTDVSVVSGPCTAANVRRALGEALGQAQTAAAARAVSAAEEACCTAGERVAALRRETERLTAEARRCTEARQRDQRLPQRPALERVVRYEAHVGRQLNQALQLLRQFQADRRARREEARPAAPTPTAIFAPEPATPPAAPVPASAPRSEAITTRSFGTFGSAPPPAAPPRDRPAPSGRVPHGRTAAAEFVRSSPVAPADGGTECVSPQGTS